MKKIQLHNSFIEHHIDTYSVFTSDSTYDYLIDDYNTEHETDLNYDDFDWTYDKENVVRELAKSSIELVLKNTKGAVIENITYVNSSSPSFYNFTTDSYTMEIEYNEMELEKWIAENRESFIAKCKKDCTPVDGFIPYNEYSDALEDDRFKLAHYIDTVYSDEEDYTNDMYEQVNEIYWNNITMTLAEKTA